MRKLLILGAIFGVILFTGEASAQYRRGHGYGYPPAPRYYMPHRNWAPYIIGGLALGMIGNYYYYQNRTCWDEIVEYDRYGNAVVTRMCR